MKERIEEKMKEERRRRKKNYEKGEARKGIKTKSHNKRMKRRIGKKREREGGG